MSYVALRFDVEAADADAWSDALLEAGALAVDAVDPRAGTAEEIACSTSATMATRSGGRSRG